MEFFFCSCEPSFNSQKQISEEMTNSCITKGQMQEWLEVIFRFLIQDVCDPLQFSGPTFLTLLLRDLFPRLFNIFIVWSQVQATMSN